MWIPTEHEKYGVGECSRANFYHALVLAPTQLAPLQAANARSWHCTAGPGLGRTGLRLRGEHLGGRSSPRTRRSSNPIPERPDSRSGLCWLAEFGAAAGRVACQVGRGSQQGFSPFYPCWPTEAESWQCGLLRLPGVMRATRNRLLEYSQTVGRREVPAAGVGIPRVQCSPCNRRSRDEASFPPRLPGVWGVYCEQGVGVVNFNICAAALFGPWRGTEILAAFLLLATFPTRQ